MLLVQCVLIILSFYISSSSLIDHIFDDFQLRMDDLPKLLAEYKQLPSD